MKPEPESNNPQRESALPSATWLEALAQDFDRRAESFNYYTANKETSAINQGHILAFREAAKTIRAQKL